MSERGRQAGWEGERARGRRRRRDQRTIRDAAPRHQGAQTGRPDPSGHTVMSAAPGGLGGRPGGGRGGGRAGRGARRRAVPGSGQAPGPLQLGAGSLRGQGCGRGRRAGLAGVARGICGFVYVPAGSAGAPSRPARSGLGAPSPPPPRSGLKFKSIQCGAPPLLAAAAVPGSALPQGLRTRHPLLPALPPPRAPPGACGRRAGGRRPGPPNNRLPPRPAGSGGRGAGPAQAPRRRQKMAAWHDPAPRPSPRLPALHGQADTGGPGGRSEG